MDFVGTGKRLDGNDIKAVAQFLECEQAAVRAVVEVECRGKGFDARNRPVVLFEPHKFYSFLGPGPKRALAVSQELAAPDWGDIPYPPTSDERYRQIQKAILISPSTALCSASWGLGQVMGFNFSKCGFPTVQALVEAAKVSEGAQLWMMAQYIRNLHLHIDLQEHNWETFARAYNGPGYAKNRYDTKLEQAYERYASKENSHGG